MSIITDHWFEDDPNYVKDGDDWVHIGETFNTHQRPVKSSEMDKGKINLEEVTKNMGEQTIVEDQFDFDAQDKLAEKINALEIELLNKDKQIKDLTINETPCRLDNVDDEFAVGGDVFGAERTLSILHKLYSDEELESGMRFLRDVVVLSATEEFAINPEFVIALNTLYRKQNKE